MPSCPPALNRCRATVTVGGVRQRRCVLGPHGAAGLLLRARGRTAPRCCAAPRAVETIRAAPGACRAVLRQHETRNEPRSANRAEGGPVRRATRGADTVVTAEVVQGGPTTVVADAGGCWTPCPTRESAELRWVAEQGGRLAITSRIRRQLAGDCGRSGDRAAGPVRRTAATALPRTIQIEAGFSSGVRRATRISALAAG